MVTVVDLEVDGDQNDQKMRIEESDETAHQICTDPWYKVGFVLTTGINSSYILGYSASIMVPLGWIGGVVGLLLATATSLYANVLVARLHKVGGKRQIRYRELAGHIYGAPWRSFIKGTREFFMPFLIQTSAHWEASTDCKGTKA